MNTFVAEVRVSEAPRAIGIAEHPACGHAYADALPTDEVYLPMTIRELKRRTVAATADLAVLLNTAIGEPLDETTVVEEAFGRRVSVAVEYRPSTIDAASATDSASASEHAEPPDAPRSPRARRSSAPVEHTLTATTAPPALADILEIAPHAPVLLVQERQESIAPDRAVYRNRWINTSATTPIITGPPLELN